MHGFRVHCVQRHDSYVGTVLQRRSLVCSERLCMIDSCVYEQSRRAAAAAAATDNDDDDDQDDGSTMTERL